MQINTFEFHYICCIVNFCRPIIGLVYQYIHDFTELKLNPGNEYQIVSKKLSVYKYNVNKHKFYVHILICILNSTKFCEVFMSIHVTSDAFFYCDCKTLNLEFW